MVGGSGVATDAPTPTVIGRDTGEAVEADLRERRAAARVRRGGGVGAAVESKRGRISAAVRLR